MTRLSFFFISFTSLPNVGTANASNSTGGFPNAPPAAVAALGTWSVAVRSHQRGVAVPRRLELRLELLREAVKYIGFWMYLASTGIHDITRT